MATQTRTKEAEETNKLILEKSEIEETNLSASDTAEIEAAFNEADDFRSIGERITAPLDTIISKTAKVIDSDPIMKVSDELKDMNGDVQDVYSEIIDNDGNVMRFFKSIPLLGSIVKTLDSKYDETAFDMKGVEGKITTIFDGFDTSYNSVNSSIDLQKEFLDGIDENLFQLLLLKLLVKKLLMHLWLQWM